MLVLNIINRNKELNSKQSNIIQSLKGEAKL